MKGLRLIPLLFLIGCSDYDANITYKMFQVAEERCLANDGVDIIYVSGYYTPINNAIEYWYMKTECNNGAAFSERHEEAR